MKHRSLVLSALLLGSLSINLPSHAQIATSSNFEVNAEAFADLQILRYQVPGFETLNLQQKKLAYYLYEAGLSGRDIIYDQKGKYNLLVRKTIENIYGTYKGDRKTADWQKFKTYAGRVWFSNGIYHHYGNEKFIPDRIFFGRIINCSAACG